MPTTPTYGPNQQLPSNVAGPIQSQIAAIQAGINSISSGSSGGSGGSSGGSSSSGSSGVGAVNAQGQLIGSNGQVIGTANPADTMAGSRPGRRVQPEGVAPQLPTSLDPSVQAPPPDTQYTVKPGDTVSTIAKAQGVPMNAISGYASGDPNKIGVGETLTIAQQYQNAHALAQQSGVPAAQGAGAGYSGAQQFMQATQGPQAESPSILGGVMDVDSNFDSILTMYDEFMSPQSQKTSLLEEYKNIESSLGIPAMNAELIDAKRIIEGTEDDIRSEITAAGGFGTESQVLALANARNKSLIKNYNYLLESRDNARTQLTTMMNLSVQDRQLASAEFDRKMNFAFKVAEFKERARDNARQTYMTLGDKMGWDTLLSSVSPYEKTVIQKTLGVSTQTLSQFATASAQQRALKGQETAMDNAIKAQQLYNLQLTGRKAERELGIGQPANMFTLSKAHGDIQMIDELTRSSALDSTVGTSFLSRGASGFGGVLGRFTTGAIGGATIGAAFGAPFAGIGAIPGAIGGALIGGIGMASQGAKDTLTGQRSEFIGGVEQLRSNLNLDALIQAKSEGATFGALSDQELKVLSNAATRLGTYAIMDDDNNVVGYRVSEKGFVREMDKINYYAKLDYILKGGAPEDVGAIIQPDGTAWVQNSDGSISQLQ